MQNVCEEFSLQNTWLTFANFSEITVFLGSLESGIIFTIVFFLMFIYLFATQNYRVGKGETEKSCIHWFTPQMASMARAGPSQGQDWAASSGFSAWLAVDQALEPLSAFFGCCQGSVGKWRNLSQCFYVMQASQTDYLLCHSTSSCNYFIHEEV